jgi:hypothetical protein
LDSHQPTSDVEIVGRELGVLGQELLQEHIVILGSASVVCVVVGRVIGVAEPNTDGAFNILKE